MKVTGRIQSDQTSLGLILALFLVVPAWAGPQLDTSNPVAFFANLASRLLKAEMNLDLARLQIYPTNQYTPAVHRLLQVTANIYEASTNRFNDAYPHLPTVFRPRFTNDNGTVYITGYVEETNAAFLSHTMRDLVSPAAANAVQPDDLLLGFPLVIGAKKGHPNFNEFSMESVFQIKRKVELVKSAPGGGNMISQTNQMFVMGISNVCGVEFWNSYGTAYPRALDIYVTNFVTMMLTNDFGFTYLTNWLVTGELHLDTNAWPGWNGGVTNGSFVVPLRTNLIFLPDLVYRQSLTRFVPNTDIYERPSGFHFPRWGLTVSNRLWAIAIDSGTGRVVDYIQLSGLNAYRDLTTEIAQSALGPGFDALWTVTTNAANGFLTDQRGVISQLEISKGNSGGNTTDWNSYGIGQVSGATKAKEIAKFIAFYTANHLASYYDVNSGITYQGSNGALTAIAPFSPTRKISLPMIWQANDPLVHHLFADLFYAERSGQLHEWWPPGRTNMTVVINLGRLNERYQPWGGNPMVTAGGTDLNADPLFAVNLAIKDPGATSSDTWQFPTNKSPALDWLGRIHRGTPWQTVYLKSPSLADAGLRDDHWWNWTGNFNDVDAQHMKPTRDWPLVTLIAALINTNDPHTLLSVNERSTNAWLAVLDGLTALTNSASDDQLLNIPPQTQFDPIVVLSNSPQAAVLAEAVRTRRLSQPGQVFLGLDSLLAIPELSVASPWLNRSTDTQRNKGISDEAYEKIPAQLLSLLRLDSVGALMSDAGALKIQFTGYDGFPYAVETSSNLLEWVSASTNFPANGVFEVTVSPVAGETQRFYRSALLP